jgi:hypothetical protein
MVASEFASIARLLGCLRHLFEWRARRSDDRGCNRTFDKGCVDEPDVPVAIAVEHLAYGEDCAAKITQEQDTVTLVGSLDRGANQLVRSAETSVLVAAGGLDAHVRPCHLTGKKRQPRRQLWAV